MRELKECLLFSRLEGDELQYALDFFTCTERQYEKGQSIAVTGNVLKSFGYLVSGCVQVSMEDIDGRRLLMATVTPGDTFGESLHFLERESPVYITSVADSRIVWMKCDRIKSGTGDNPELDRILTNRFISLLAGRTLAMNDRIQVLSKPSIREKLITLFSQYTAKYGSNSFSVPFDRTAMAEYLGVDRSALSRELSHMKKLGIIDYKKDKFTIMVRL